MPGRYSYTSPWSRGNDPWFRIGQIDVTTTVGLIGLGIISVFVWAIEGRSHEISLKLLLDPQRVQDGEIWRLITWPLVNQASFWTIFLFFILLMSFLSFAAVLSKTFTVRLPGTAIPHRTD